MNASTSQLLVLNARFANFANYVFKYEITVRHKNINVDIICISIFVVHSSQVTEADF